MLNYQEKPPLGKRNGRYIDQPDKGDAVDIAKMYETTMHNGRQLQPPASLDTMGFTLADWPTAVKDFRDDAEVEKVYYEELRNLVKQASGAKHVLIFDHTIRESGNTNLNAAAGGSAAPVPRVHCDYTAEGAPKRLRLLGKKGINSLVRGRILTEAEVDELSTRRFAFINVWRSVSDDAPVHRMPLAVMDEKSMNPQDKFLYELIFPDRVGENYSLEFSKDHKWYYYPLMQKSECLVFKVYEKLEDGPRFVFHTAFDDPRCPGDAPPRISIEARAVAFFADDPADDFKTDPSQEPLTLQDLAT
jgi:hypothetical protein